MRFCPKRVEMFTFPSKNTIPLAFERKLVGKSILGVENTISRPARRKSATFFNFGVENPRNGSNPPRIRWFRALPGPDRTGQNPVPSISVHYGTMSTFLYRNEGFLTRFRVGTGGFGSFQLVQALFEGWKGILPLSRPFRGSKRVFSPSRGHFRVPAECKIHVRRDHFDVPASVN